MTFASPQYALLLSVVFWLYWSVRSPRGRLVVLLVASYVFYSAWNPAYVLLLAGSTLLDYGVGCGLDRTEAPRARRLLLGASLAGNLGVLGVFKYLGFGVTQANALLAAAGLPGLLPHLRILLPVGISFYTFQKLTYTVGVYRRELPATRDLLQFATFAAFFPQLLAGPILRAPQFLPQLAAPRPFRTEDALDGVHRILRGLLKKALFADALGAALVDPVFGAPARYGGLAIWLATYGYAVQIYSDFSGYSDIAIGSAKLLGFRVPENFQQPYLATDLRDFWRRWHISLSTWLRDYLYIPLGGSRRGHLRTQLNLLVTMLLGGLWHGANWTFVVWGAIHGVMLAVNRHLQRRAERRPGPPRRPLNVWLRRLGTFHLVCLAWVFFRADSVGAAAAFLRAAGRPSLSLGELGQDGLWGLLLLGLGLAMHFGHGAWKDSLARRFVGLRVTAQAAVAVGVICVVAMATQMAKPFIYFQF